MMQALFSLRNVSCSYGGDSPVIDVPALDIPVGGIIAILGESGAGKSTLLNILGALHPVDKTSNRQAAFSPNENTYIDLTQAEPGDYCSFIFQNSYLFESASIGLNLDLMEISKSTDEDIVQTLEKFGIEVDKTRISGRVRNLSGGQKRRLALIAALLRDRDTILADELTSDLDPIWAYKSLQILKDWQHEKPTRTILWVTHNYEQALEFADKVLIVTPDGRLHPYHQDDTGVSHPKPWPKGDIATVKKMISESYTPPEDMKIPAVISKSHETSNSKSGFGINGKDIHSAGRLALMTSFEQSSDGSGIKGALSSLRILPHIFILSIILFLSALAFGVWDFVKQDVDRQKQDPQAQHFVIVQNMRADNTRLREKELSKLNAALLIDDSGQEMQNPFADCFTELGQTDNLDKLDKRVYGRIEQSEQVLLPLAEGETPRVRRARLLLLEPDDPLLACMPLRNPDGVYQDKRLGSYVEYSDKMRLAVSQGFYNQVFAPAGLSDMPFDMSFARGLSPKGPSYEVVGILDTMPYSDRFAIDAVTTTKIFAAWRSTVGENRIKDFDSASVYFNENSAGQTIEAMQAQKYIFNIEAYTKFVSVIALRNVIEDGFRIFGGVVLFSVLSTIAFLAWQFLSKFCRPIGILAAHNRPTTIILICFLIQLAIAIAISAVISGAMLVLLALRGGNLSALINVNLFLQTLLIITLGAMIGAVASFALWKLNHRYAMKMLKI